MAILVISLIALGIGGYAFASPFLVKVPTPQNRTFRISIDFYNATSGSSFYTSARFTPDTITALEGDTVVMNVTNRDPRPISSTAGTHGFTVDGTTISRTVDPGATISVTVTSVKDGIYRFYCQLHPAHLAGQLVVMSND